MKELGIGLLLVGVLYFEGDRTLKWDRMEIDELSE